MFISKKVSSCYKSGSKFLFYIIFAYKIYWKLAKLTNNEENTSHWSSRTNWNGPYD
jgi:hypothetical protein